LVRFDKLWKSLGGAATPPPPPPPKSRGTIWMASNAALGIDNDNSTRHPALVLSAKPLVVVSGSDSHRYDLDAVVVTITNEDLLPTPKGSGLDGATQFDVCGALPLSSPDELVRFIGKVTDEVWAGILEARKSCY